jgi:transcriptional regulator with XRE-family HTH domain
MGRKKKEFNKNGPFQVRFRNLWNKSGLTQEALAIALGVSRPTAVGWLDGKNIPDIISLTKISQYFNVSSDYLLGLSDTVNPDVNARAAVQYTGLSEAAVERLHTSFDHPKYYFLAKSDIEKKEVLNTASALIANSAFENMIASLGEVSKWAYLERALRTLKTQHSTPDLSDDDSFTYCISVEDRDKISSELLQALSAEGFYISEYELDRLKAKIEEYLVGDTLLGMLNIRESLDHCQFLVSKSIMGYLDQLVKESKKRAILRFGE